MKPEFVEYIAVIGVPAALQERIAIHYECFQAFCPEEIGGIFVTDYITKEATRIYGSLHFVSDSFIMEAKEFATDDHLEMALFERPLKYWTLRKQDYDLKKATEASRIYFTGHLTENLGFELKGSKENCDFLRDLVLRYFLPRPRR